MRLEDIKPQSKIRGLTSYGIARVIDVTPNRSYKAVSVIFEDENGGIAGLTLFPADCERLTLVSEEQYKNRESSKIRLVIESHCIKLAYHFDPYLAITTSVIDSLPHQITAVYDEMLDRQPLRFLLADDPGAGKTIMAGLLIKELIVRSDLERCLIVVPGNLVEQWHTELSEKFNLGFDILTRDTIQSKKFGNLFNDKDHLIARLDMLARNESLLEKIECATEWDLVIVDEAHRMSASFFSGEIRRTKRYQLGQELSKKCRHFLLMSGTPHNGKEEDFQLFMALLDSDRFEGRFRRGVHAVETQDMMRRLTKEELLKFDGRPLFPERFAYTVRFELSDPEALLYAAVTEYVRNGMNRLDGDAVDIKRRVNVGFALQILQRRLASSPAAIHNSLKRRHDKLQEILKSAQCDFEQHLKSTEDLRNLDELAQSEFDKVEDFLSTSVTYSETIEQLEQEVATLQKLEAQAAELLSSDRDTKWRELCSILDDERMIDCDGNRRKLVIFTEARDTLMYLVTKIRAFINNTEAVGFIHGGVSQENRSKTIRRFMHDEGLIVLVANDAAGEGVNLQSSNLMINYDLPWNPNRIEQRFGRIHRIGQTKVCHLWNMVAADTREGRVYVRLLEKLEEAQKALRGQVFDVLGDLFDGKSLRDLLLEAIQYSERDDVRAKLDEAIDGIVDIEHIKKIMDQRKLTHDVLPEVEDIRHKMEFAEVQCLQPHHIQSFFMEAFSHFNGKILQRENGRFEITKVPECIRKQQAGVRKNYVRICFDKKHISKSPEAELVSPGHPLLESVLDLIHADYDFMDQNAVMVNESDMSEEVRAIFLVEHEIYRANGSGEKKTVSKKIQFVCLSADGEVENGGLAPHLDLRPISNDEEALLSDEISADWLQYPQEDRISEFADKMAERHLKDIKDSRLPEIDKVKREVETRLNQEISHWKNRAAALKEEEKEGKNTRLSWQNAERSAEELSERLQSRLEKFEEERRFEKSFPFWRRLRVVPQGLLNQKKIVANVSGICPSYELDYKQIEEKGLNAVIEKENALGNVPKDVSDQKLGYDILSFDPETKKHRFISVKSCAVGADSVTMARNEIIVALNKQDDFILAIVQVEKEIVYEPDYFQQLFNTVPPFDTASIKLELRELLGSNSLS